MQPAQQATAYSPGRQPWGGDAELLPVHAVGDSPAAAARVTGYGALWDGRPRVPLRSTLGYILTTRFAGSIQKLFFLNSITSWAKHSGVEPREGFKQRLLV